MNEMNRSGMIVAVVLLAMAAGCSSAIELGTTGSVNLSLAVGDVDIDRVEFEISGGPLESPISGNFVVDDERDPPIWSAIMDLPVGDGYTITLIARDDEGNVICEGSRDFDIVEDETTKVNVVLNCRVGGDGPTGDLDFDATFNICPEVQYIMVSPDSIPEDGTALAQVAASDADDDPLTVSWTATAGSFWDPEGTAVEYSCDWETGVQTLTATVSDGYCETEASVEVTCGADPGIPPLSPGYWKNHCDEALLPQTIGCIEVETCEVAVEVLDERDLDTGEKRANDAAYNLARQLLATRFNFAAGAMTCGEAEAAAEEAQELLHSIGFDGAHTYLPPGAGGADRETALELAAILDLYNNDLLCD